MIVSTGNPIDRIKLRQPTRPPSRFDGKPRYQSTVDLREIQCVIFPRLWFPVVLLHNPPGWVIRSAMNDGRIRIGKRPEMMWLTGQVKREVCLEQRPVMPHKTVVQAGTVGKMLEQVPNQTVRSLCWRSIVLPIDVSQWNFIVQPHDFVADNFPANALNHDIDKLTVSHFPV